jgi:hypothetical protein
MAPRSNGRVPHFAASGVGFRSLGKRGGECCDDQVPHRRRCARCHAREACALCIVIAGYCQISERVDEMASGGKKKTTMAKLARENRLRERRVDKQARKDARKQAASDRTTAPEETVPAVASEPRAPAAAEDLPDSHSDEAVRAFMKSGIAPTDPRAKEVALLRLRDSPDEELAVFEGKLRDDAFDAGASEQEMRQAQRDHPGHEA